MVSLKSAALFAASLCTLVASAQTGGGDLPPVSREDVGYDTMHFETAIGSFKIQSYNDQVPIWGHLEMSFTGTVLVSGLKGSIQTKGNLVEEYQNKKVGKTVYHGTGTLILSGKWGSLQWFGRGFKGAFSGRGIFRFYGEYDRNLSTGTYYFGNETNFKQPWFTSGVEIYVPLQKALRQTTIKVKDTPPGG